MPRARTRRRWVAILAAILAPATAVPALAGDGADDRSLAVRTAVASVAPPSAQTRAGEGGRAPVVTLVTGDRIEVHDGNEPRATVIETAPGTTTYSVFRAGDSLYVIPDQALPLIASGHLDRRLFDVTGLIEQGYDDASTPELPVIVEYAGPTLARRDPPTAAQVSRTLPSLDAVAADVRKRRAAAFWHDLAADRTVSLDDGAAEIWLDAQVEANLDRSVGQIGAPAAWARGLDGSGVTVAVLDTGVDVTHPDLAGQVVDARNFTEESDTDDYVGHGTHVASTVAGTGAGSDGTYVGVAPGADLLNGKVLQLGFVGPGIPTGVGQESWILAGMEWAVAQHADIVNMSLGNSFSDGNDPLSRAVDELSAESDTLFVVSAGNSGPGHYTVGGPAAADAALAVGSVDRDDTTSVFSSRGPRMVDGAIKPDVTAPGSDIVAARAAHARIGRRVSPLYSSMSGTSMAAPHVAGAAALLLQQHPSWGPDDIRSALTGTAAFNDASDVYEQGAGRIDVDRATRQDVTVDTGVLNLGYFAAGSSDLQASQRLTYRNASDGTVTLHLAATAEQGGEPAPESTLTVSPETLEVPAGGSAEAFVSANLAGRRPGAYSGRVVATGDAGLTVGTSVGFTKQGDEVKVTFRALDRNGRPSEAFLILRDPRDPFSYLPVAVPRGGTSTVTLDASDYAYLGYIPTYDATGDVAELTVIADPELSPAQPNPTITLDGRDAQPMGVQVPRDVDVNGLTVGLQVVRPDAEIPIEESMLFARGPSFGRVPAVPMSVLPFDAPVRGHGNLDSFWSLVSPRARAEVTAPRHLDLPVELMDGSARLDGRLDLTVADLGSGAVEEYQGRDVAGGLVLVRETDGLSFTDQASAAYDAGAAAVMISAASPGRLHGDAYADIPVLAVSQADGDSLRDLADADTSVHVLLTGTSSSTYLYDLTFREHDRVRANTVYTPGQLAEVRTTYHATSAQEEQRFWGRRTPAWGAVCGYCADAAREGEDWYGGTSRTEYVTPRVRWHESLLQNSWLWWEAERSYPPGLTSTSWGKAPLAPGVPIAAGVRSVRQDGQLHLRLAGYTDADPEHFYPLSQWWFHGETSLTRDGEPLGECVTFTVLECDVEVPDTDSTYTLTAHLPPLHFTDAVPESTTTWTFGSAPGEAVLPLLDLDFDLPLSLDNTLPAGTPATLHLGVRRQPGSTGGPVAMPRVQLSYDDGASWRDVAVVSLEPGQYQARFKQPDLAATNGFVSLRVTARDADGNSVKQEVNRAYRLVG
jgi:subtilisin family serine protease